MSERIEVQIERFLRTGEGHFGELALELYAYQFEKNLPYRAFSKACQKFPGQVTRWEDIPAVPISAFKSSELATFPIGQSAAVFHSSGTTQKSPSRHFMRTLTYYETALQASFAQHVLQERSSMPIFLLAPAPGEAPHSSLSWMLEVIKRKWGAPGSDTFIQRGSVQDWRLFKALTAYQDLGKPVFLLGTTLAYLSLFDLCAKQNKSFRCAPGTRLLDTGGMKTQNREVTRLEFLRLVWTYLGIPEADCVNEYGMCEMSSQFYGRGSSMVFQGPPWVKTLVVDPQSGDAVKSGQSGLLRHFDLANIDSVLAIQTEDEGELRPEGFLFKGRAKNADLKGCSLDLENYFKQP
jgi:hypothetical protein